MAREEKALPFDGFLHANDFRISTYPKNEVVDVGGGLQRVFVVWDGCQFRPLGTVCEEPQIKLAWSDDNGQTWQGPKVLSQGGDNYFPTISHNGAGQLAVAWFTNRFDTQFHAQQDVELLKVDASTVGAGAPTRLTDPSNQTTADPILGGLFIGDYIDVFANAGTVWTGYNANYRALPLLGEGVAVPQQDNYLDVRGF